MTAFVEYDKAAYDFALHGGPSDPSPPFSPTAGEPYSLTCGSAGIYTGSKDYLFFGAIAGVRNETGVPPLFPPRGLPPNPSPEVRQRIKDWDGIDQFSDGWLTTAEVEAALDHQGVERDLLSFETRTILAVMADLERRLGPGRVRLVFGFG